MAEREVELPGEGTSSTASLSTSLMGFGGPGSQLVSAKERYLIRSMEFVDRKNVPLTAIGLLIDNDRIKESIVVGEEVWTTP
jgi:hypothetical protein